MKYLTFTILIILSLSFAGYGQRTNRSVSRALAIAKANEKAVGLAFDRLVEGIRQNDSEKVMSVYHKHPKTLFFNNNGSATIGWETMKRNRDLLYEKTKNVTLEITGLRVAVLSVTSAYVSCKWKQGQEFDGELESASGRLTLIFRKINKAWKVVHVHTSPDNPPPDRPVFPSERKEKKPDDPKSDGQQEPATENTEGIRGI